MGDITSSVGNAGVNLASNVKVVQTALNRAIYLLMPCQCVIVDGDAGPLTVGLIKEFQYRVLGSLKPDGRVDPGKSTIKKLNEVAAVPDKKPVTTTVFSSLLVFVQAFYKTLMATESPVEKKVVKPSELSEKDYERAATLIGVEVAAIKAVSYVESAGGGFLKNGKPKILFEGHWFSKLTKAKFDSKYPAISYKKWTKKHYKGGEAEYSRYDQAFQLDKSAAMKSTSWGKFQIMGFNHKYAGFDSVEKFVKKMYESEGNQLLAFTNFIKAKKLDAHLKTKDWASFAYAYNGSAYAENKYDIRMRQAYEAFSK